MSRFVLPILLFVVMAVTPFTGDRLEGAPVIASDLTLSSHGEHITLSVSTDGEPAVKSFVMEDPPRIVIDLASTLHRLPRMNYMRVNQGSLKNIRTSQFTSDPESVMRLVLDVDEHVSYKVESTDGEVVIELGTNSDSAGTGGTPQKDAGTGEPHHGEGGVGLLVAAIEAERSVEETPVSTQPPTMAQVTQAPASAQAPAEKVDHRDDASQKDAPEVHRHSSSTGTPVTAPKKPDTTVQSKEAKRIPLSRLTRGEGRGGIQEEPELVSLDFQDTDIRTVLRGFSEISGKNVIVSADVGGKVTATLRNVPWRDAFEIILKANDFIAIEESDNVIRVTTLVKYREEELNREALMRKKDDLVALETRLIRINYARAGELVPVLQDMMTKRGKIRADASSNSVIITDINSSIKECLRLIDILDIQTPQIEIESKLVQVDTDFLRETGVDWNAVKNSDSLWLSAQGVSEGEPQIGGKFSFGMFDSKVNVDATVAALEKDDKGNIIAQPKVVTLDNREAVILAGEKIPLKVLDAMGNTITKLFDVGTKLIVTPHITSDRKIILDLHAERSNIAAVDPTIGPRIATQEADTRLLVENGQTAIIGGFTTSEEKVTDKGVPFLHRIPLLGRAFKYSRKNIIKRDLIIFVTPRVVESPSLYPLSELTD
jgi:type IV pilus assembly protein PilQ